MALLNLIDETYFENHPCYIPLNEYDGETILIDIINEFQVVVLKNALGEVEYNNFVNDLDISGVPGTQKWIDFLDGYNYTVDSKNVVWGGFKNMLKYFIYYYYERNQYTYSTPTGQNLPNLENSQNVTPGRKMVNILNEGINIYGVDWSEKFIYYNDKGEYMQYNYYPNIFNFTYYETNLKKYNSKIEKYKNTLYNFMYNRYETDFPDWQFTRLKTINQFDI